MGIHAKILSEGNIFRRYILKFGGLKMIFITLGSQKFQFNRLLKAVDELIQNGTITDTVFAQIGYSDYKPVHYHYIDFLDYDEFIKEIEKGNIIITHGGTGAIINAVKRKKKVIAIPRLAQYGEHVDNHQLQLINEFKELGLVCECLSVDKIGEALEKVMKTEYRAYQSNTQTIIDNIEKYIESLVR